MKTQDSISKKRQKLAQEIAFWKARERDLRANPLFSTDRTGQIVFCRQEAAKRQTALEKLAGGTWRQRRAGWR